MQPSRHSPNQIPLTVPSIVGSSQVEVKIRLDANTVEHLRGSGPGWQTRVNALLGQLVANGQI